MNFAANNTSSDPLTPTRQRFVDEFSAEIDLFDVPGHLPSRIFRFREDQLRKLSPELRKICRALKDLGLSFKIKWPIRIDDEWKFADVYFPKNRTVLIVSNPITNFRPLGLPSYRAEFFSKHFRVVEVETLADLERKMEMKSRAAERINHA